MRIHCIAISIIWLALTLPCHARGPTAATVTDQLGRRVTVPERPARVVALAPSITEIIFDLGCQDRLVGVTRYSDYPPQAKTLPQVGSYVQLNLEKIAALRPDLCIAVKDGNPIAVVRRMESLHIPVYAVDPRDFAAIGTTVIEIGRLLGAEDAARAITADMESRINRVEARVAKLPSRPKVFFQIGISPIVAPGTNTFIHELIALAGGINVTAGPVPYPRISREQILALAPEVVIITSMARHQGFEQVKAQWRRWSDLPAVRSNRIHVVDSNLFDRATPRLVEGLEQLARLIHPPKDRGLP
ncbi:MAG: cobalamin-binding protein [Desulfosarcinaceae bacterium]|jgi:iron complex transport system substrate-binding protein